jgi:2-polyprenyl-3-methyl-5-hydroxy-6-metoxy-1,4-benzoquinol methylase
LRCPCCDGLAAALFSKRGHTICGCAACGHRFVAERAGDDHVQRVYGDEYFEGGGAGYSGYAAEAELLREAGRWYGRLLGRFIERRTLLDVGCAGGFRLQGLIDEGFQGHGLEPNASMVALARERLGLAVERGTLERHAADRRYGVVTMLQVVPHFFDLDLALAAAARLTEPGGFWLIETWNVESWTARCFGQRWHEYSPPSVRHWFSPESLRRLAGRFGFRETARGRPPKRIGGRHAKALLRHKLGASILGRGAARLVGLLPDRLSVPYPGDDVFWALFARDVNVLRTAPGAAPAGRRSAGSHPRCAAPPGRRRRG